MCDILEHRVYLFLMYTACGIVFTCTCVCVCVFGVREYESGYIFKAQRRGKFISIRANKPPIERKTKTKHKNTHEYGLLIDMFVCKMCGIAQSKSKRWANDSVKMKPMAHSASHTHIF